MGSREARRRWGVVVVALATLLVGELVVRARESSLPEPLAWFGPEMPIKDRQIRRLEQAGGASVIAVGSSTMDVSFDPSQMHGPASGLPIYNAATGAGSLRMIDIWTRYLAVPRLDPDVVVFGIVSRELNPNDPAQVENERAFFDAPAVKQLLGTEGRLEVAERRASDLSALFRYRKVIREPDNLLALLDVKETVTGRTYGDIIANDGQYEGFLDRPFIYNADVAKEISSRALRLYDIGGVQLRTLRTMLRFLDENVPHVIVINMPVTNEYIAAHPHGRADYDRYVAALEVEVAQVGVTYLDLGVWSSDLFADPAHLNRVGSRRLTELIDAEVAKVTTH